MGVVQRHTDFRWLFAKRVKIPGTFTFANPSGFSSILRAAGDFVADGVKVGMSVHAVGSALNDGRLWTVSPLWQGSADQSTLLLLDRASTRRSSSSASATYTAAAAATGRSSGSTC
jgi:hypothetical protein